MTTPGVQQDTEVSHEVSEDTQSNTKISSVDLGFMLRELGAQEWQDVPLMDGKVGGFPAWLHTPGAVFSTCGICGQPLKFLLQIDAPIAAVDAYYRALYVFVCPDMACLQQDQHHQRNHQRTYPPRRSVKVFRTQLPQQTSALPDSAVIPGCEFDTPWPEWELQVDMEENCSPELSPEIVGCGMDCGKDCGEDADVAEVHEDEVWAEFEARIARAPEQVVRYYGCADIGPLWVASEGQPEEGHIPACSGCGGERRIEFQVMPKLLHYLEEEVLSWATIAVYTCENSCDQSDDGSGTVAEEFAWVQLHPHSFSHHSFFYGTY